MGEEHRKSAQMQPTYKEIVKGMGLNWERTIQNGPTPRVLQLSVPCSPLFVSISSKKKIPFPMISRDNILRQTYQELRDCRTQCASG